MLNRIIIRRRLLLTGVSIQANRLGKSLFHIRMIFPLIHFGDPQILTAKLLFDSHDMLRETQHSLLEPNRASFASMTTGF